MSELNIILDNAQGVPKIVILNEDKEKARIYICKDGAIIKTNCISVGTNLGCRKKENQSDFEDAENNDGISIPVNEITEKASKKIFKEGDIVTYAYKISRNKDGSVNLSVTPSRIIEVLNNGIRVREVSEGTNFVYYNWIYSWFRDGKIIYNLLFNEEKLKQILAGQGRWGKSEEQIERENEAWQKQQKEFKIMIDEDRKGLYGCSSKGVLYTPSGKVFLWLPPFLAFRLHTFLNRNR